MHSKSSLRLPNLMILFPIIVLTLRFLFSIGMYIYNTASGSLLMPVIKEYGNYILGFFLALSIPSMIAGFFLRNFNKEYNHRLESADLKQLQGDSTSPTYEDSGTDIGKLGIDAILGPMSGRISRGEYIQGNIILYLIPLVFLGLNVLISMSNGTTGKFIDAIPSLTTLIGSIVLYIKRFHDLNKKWTHIFYLLIPIYNIYIIALLRLKVGTIGSNRYGKDPLNYQPRTNTWYFGNGFLILLGTLGLYLGMSFSLLTKGEQFIQEKNNIEVIQEAKEVEKEQENSNIKGSKDIDTLSDLVYKEYCIGKSISLNLQDHTNMKKDEVINYIQELLEEGNEEGASFIMQDLIEEDIVGKEYFDNFYDKLNENTLKFTEKTASFNLQETAQNLLENDYLPREEMFLLGDMGVKTMVEGDFDGAKKYLECAATLYGSPRSMYLLATIYAKGSEGMKVTFPDIKIEKEVQIDYSKSLFWATSALTFDRTQKTFGPGSSPQRNSIGMMDRYTKNPEQYGIDLKATNKSIGNLIEKRYVAKDNTKIKKEVESPKPIKEKSISEKIDTQGNISDSEVISIAKEKTLLFVELYNDNNDITQIADEMILSKDGSEKKSLENIRLPNIKEKMKEKITETKFIGYRKKEVGNSLFYTLYTETNPFGIYKSINGLYLAIVVHPSEMKFNGISTITKTTIENLKNGENEEFVELEN